jgi:ATP-dependent Clp protease ATP-binding subunit ClpC
MQNGSFDRFTERVRKVLTLAQEEALRLNHAYIGTEHLLLGLVREGEGVAAKVLSSLGIELAKVRSSVEFILGRGERQVMGDIGMTPRAKKVIELAVDEARRLGHRYVGTEHLLLGLIREGEGMAAGVLESLGVSLEKARSEVIKILTGLASVAESWPGKPGSGAGRHPRWEYRSIGVEFQGAEPRVRPGQHVPQGLEGQPILQALQSLDADGWELVGIDANGPAGSFYILKRRAWPPEL